MYFYLLTLLPVEIRSVHTFCKSTQNYVPLVYSLVAVRLMTIFAFFGK